MKRQIKATAMNLHAWADALRPALRVMSAATGCHLRLVAGDRTTLQEAEPPDAVAPQALLYEHSLLAPGQQAVALQLWGPEDDAGRHLRRDLVARFVEVLEAESELLEQLQRRHELLRLRHREVDLLFHFSPLRIQRDSRSLALGALIEGVARLQGEGFAIASLLSDEYSRIRGRIGTVDHEQITGDGLSWSVIGTQVLEHLDRAGACWSSLPAEVLAEFELRCQQVLEGCCVPIEVDGRALGYVALVRPLGARRRPGPSTRLLRGLAHRISSALASIHLRSERHLFLFNTVKSLIAVVEAKDRYTRGHSERVHYLAMRTGARLRLSAEDMESLNWAAILHDIGKLYIPGAVLSKRSSLDDDEWALIRTHPERGCQLLTTIPRLGPALPGIRHHHENFGGGGYPDGLTGEAIPRLARIIAAADAFDTMTSDRPYLQHVSCRNALEVLREKAGSKFDPQVVEAISQVIEGELLSGTLAFEALRGRATQHLDLEPPGEAGAEEEAA